MRRWTSISTENVTQVAKEILSDSPSEITSTQGQTSFEDHAPAIEVQKQEIVLLRSITNPFDDNTPTAMLTRLYDLGTVDWTTTMTPTIYQFPKDLFAVTNIARLLKTFRYFRGGVKIHLKLNSTPYHQGSLIVGWLPSLTFTSPSVKFLSMCNSVVLSASIQDSCDIEIPYLWPQHYIDLEFPQDFEIGSLAIMPLNTISSPSTITTTVKLSVFAGFVDPEIVGFQQQSTAKKKRNKEAEARSTSVDVPGVAQVVSPILRSLPVIGAVYNPIADFINSLSGNLSKPTSTNQIQKTTRIAYSGFAVVDGVDCCEPMGMYGQSKLSVDTSLITKETSNMSITAYAMRPALYDQFSISTTLGVVWTAYAHPYFVNSTVPIIPDHLSFAAGSFKRWRGGIKYCFHIVSNAFSSARVRVSMVHNGVSVTPDGDVPSRVVDVKGDTFIDVCVPYLNRSLWSPTVPPSDDYLKSLLMIQFEVLTPVLGGTLPADGFMDVNVWRAGAEDMAFNQLINASKLYGDDLSSFVQQSFMGKHFSKRFESCCKYNQSTEEGLASSEKAMTITDCLKRYCSGADTTDMWPGKLASYTYGREPYHYWANTFLFWRGARRLHNSTQATNRVHFSSTYNTELYGNGHLPQSSDSSYIRVEVPWFASHSHLVTGAWRADVATFADSEAESVILEAIYTDFACCAGDDFTLLFVMPPSVVFRPLPPPKPADSSTRQVEKPKLVGRP